MNMTVTGTTPSLPGGGLVATALFLDFDGTLVELAPTPCSVRIPPALPGLLERLHDALGGALALLSGRPLETLDGFLAPLRLPAAAEHGLVLRRSGHAAPEPVAAPAVPPAWREAAEALAAATPGVLCEQKSYGFTLHARAVPDALPRLGEALRELLGGHPDFRLMPAHMAWEVKPRVADKGTALAALMRFPPFAGRCPVFVGDDVTDEDAIAAARSLGGAGYRVGESFGDPLGVRAWLARLAAETAHG